MDRNHVRDVHVFLYTIHFRTCAGYLLALYFFATSEYTLSTKPPAFPTAVGAGLRRKAGNYLL